MNYLVTIFVFLNYSHLAKAAQIDDYCKPNPENTPCATRCVRHSRCGRTQDKYAPLTEAEREIVLDRHNTFREEVAKGALADHYLPPCAGGIAALSWDKECEFSTTCHMLQCIWNQDKVRLTWTNQQMGQNLHLRIVNTEQGFNPDFIQHAIQNWYDEYRFLTSNEADMYKNFKKKHAARHLIAMLWGNVQYVGCGKMHYFTGNKHRYTLFCNYFPAGNLDGAWMYENKTCEEYNDKYPALCGRIRPYDEDKYISPIAFMSSHPTTAQYTNVFGPLSIFALIHLWSM